MSNDERHQQDAALESAAVRVNDGFWTWSLCHHHATHPMIRCFLTGAGSRANQNEAAIHMKRALIIVATVLVSYVVTFLAFKLSKPAFLLVYKEPYHELAPWYGALPFPARQLSALLFGDDRLKDGVFTFEGTPQVGWSVFLRDHASGIVRKLSVYNVPANEKLLKLKDGCDVQVTFRSWLFTDPETFEDRICYAVDDITPIAAK